VVASRTDIVGLSWWLHRLSFANRAASHDYCR